MPPDGGGLFVRQYLVYGKAWQRAGIVLALIAVGATLIAFGSLIGILPELLGVVIGIRMWGPTRLRAARFRSDQAKTTDTPLTFPSGLPGGGASTQIEMAPKHRTTLRRIP